MSEHGKPTEEQARAWLCGVLSPLIAGIEQERYFLKQRNPTWRFRAKRAEFIRRLREYVDAAQEPTLRQFFRYRADYGALAERHDAALNALENAASQAHASLVALAPFQELEKVIGAEFSDWRGAYPPEDGLALLAENTINWTLINTLPDHYANAKAWAKHGPAALKLRQDPTTTEKCQALEKALDELRQTTDELQEALSNYRDNLADSFGLPPVPPPAESEHLFQETF